MAFLREHHRQTCASSPANAHVTWQELMYGGAEAHKSGAYQRAYQCFRSASEIARLILDTIPRDRHQPHPMDMWVTATHNLSATLDAAGQGGDAEALLRQLHHDLSALCLSPNGQRHVRVAALACLDTALFSLTSQLGKSGKVGDIYQVIQESDQVGHTASQQLFH